MLPVRGMTDLFTFFGTPLDKKRFPGRARDFAASDGQICTLFIESLNKMIM